MKKTTQEQDKTREAEAISKQYQQEIESTLFDFDEPDETRYQQLKDGKAVVDRYLRSQGIDGA